MIGFGADLWIALSTYWKVIVSYLFQNSKNSQPYFFAGKNLFFPSFRLPEKAENDPFLALRVLYRVLRVLFKKGEADPFELSFSNGMAVFDGSGNPQVQEKRLSYVAFFSGERPQYYIGREQLILGLNSVGGQLLIFFWIMLAAPFVWFFSLFSKAKRPGLALLLQEIPECAILLNLLKKGKVHQLYFFSIYNVDANAMTLALQRRGVKVDKIPSEVPLGFNNQIIISDTLSLCNAYQEEELIAYADSMFFKEKRLWGPENIVDVLNDKRSGSFPDKDGDRFKVGFYSSAGWYRKAIGMSSLGRDLKGAEDSILLYLKEWAEEKGSKILIFLHPLEKKVKDQQWVRKYYNQLFGNDHYQIADLNVPSNHSFEKAEIGLSMFSTIMYERLFFGHKTILMPLNTQNFPIEGSSMRNICCFTKEELFHKLDLSLSLSREGFFKENDILSYAFYNHPLYKTHFQCVES